MQAGLALQQAESGRQTTTLATAAEAKCFSWFEQDHSSFGACTSPTTTAACTQRGGPTTTASLYTARPSLQWYEHGNDHTTTETEHSFKTLATSPAKPLPESQVDIMPRRLGNPQAATKGNSCTQCTERSCSRTRPWRTVLQCEETKPFTTSSSAHSRQQELKQHLQHHKRRNVRGLCSIKTASADTAFATNAWCLPV